MAVNLSPVGGVAAQFFDNNGVILSGGKIYTYAAGTTTNQTTYTSASGLTAHTNPIILDSAGRVPSGEIWLTDGLSYKFVIKNTNDVLIGTYDNIIGINSNFVNFTNSQEIQTATAGQTVFTLTTMQYQPGTGSLSVFVDGVNQYGPGAQYAFVETGPATVTFVSGLHVGASVKFTTSQLNTSGAVNASQVTYDPAGTGAVATNVQAKLRESANVRDFGAVPDGVTPSNTAINLMAAEYGFIVIPSGDFAVTTTNIDTPIFFQAGGAITVPTANTVTFRTRISASSKQQIFKGVGDIRFEIDNALGIGEDSKHAYAAWWGIFPVGQTNNIQTALFNKALGAYTSQAREGVFELDVGSYRIDGTVTIPRGVWFKGNSTRRTIIDLVGSGYTALRTAGSAAKITGIQFEQPTGSEAYFDGIQFEILHDTAVIEDVIIWNARIGIFLGEDAAGAVINTVRGIYGNEPVGGYPAGSAAIQVFSDQSFIEDVRVSNTSFGPESVILIGGSGGGTSTILNTNINDINCSEKSIPVKIAANNQNVSNVSINGVLFFGDTGNNIAAVIDISSSGATDVQGIAISNVSSNSIAASLLRITQGSSGITQSISFASGTATSSSTKAVDLIRTSGTLTRVAIGQAVQASQASVPVTTTGTMTEIVVPSSLLPRLTIADDAVGQVNLLPFQTGGLITIINTGNGGSFPNIGSSGQVLYDVGATSAISKTVGGANLVTLAANTVPTGTTGVDGDLSVSAVNTGIFYFENRTGGSIQVRFSLQ